MDNQETQQNSDTKQTQIDTVMENKEDRCNIKVS